MTGSRIAVLGLGNVLMGDDGAGPFAIASLKAQFDIPDCVTVEDIGTPGLDLIPYLSGLDGVILIDTILSDAAPGAIRLHEKHTLLKMPTQPRLSPHDPALGQCIANLEMEGLAPKYMLLIGVVPECVKFGPGLSATVKGAIPAVLDRVVEELKLGGVAVRRRSPAAEPDLWWEVPLVEMADANA